MWLNPQETADLVTFTEKVLNGKLHFLCSVTLILQLHCSSYAKIMWRLLKMFWVTIPSLPSPVNHQFLNILRQLIALPIWLGGIAVTTLHLKTGAKYNAPRLLTKDIVDQIISQNTEYKHNKERISEIKNHIKKGRTESENINLRRIRDNMSKE